MVRKTWNRNMREWDCETEVQISELDLKVDIYKFTDASKFFNF